jgi:hypothetical protein
MNDKHFPPIVAGNNATETWYRWLFDIQGFVVTVFKEDGTSVMGELHAIDDDMGTLYLRTQHGEAPALPQPPIPVEDIKAIMVE